MDKASNNIMSTRSWEKKHDDDECLHYDSDEESSGCGCGGFIGFKRNNQVFDYSLSSEIGDDDDSEELFEINLKEPLEAIREEDCESNVFSLDFNNNNNEKDVVYVAVGDDNGGSSIEALSWTLKHAVTPSTTVSLVHVFPQVKLIPTPLGKIPRSHVNLEHVNIHLTLEKSKRKLLLHKFIDLCVDSQVKVEMMLIEGDNVAKAIVDLVGNLNIRKLVIGITPSSLRKAGSRRQNAIAEMVLKNAQESCDIKIICEGREVIDQMVNGCTPPPRSSDNSSSRSVSHEIAVVDESRDLVPLKRLMPNPLWLFRSRFLSPR